MSAIVLTSETLIGTPATGNLEYNGQFFGTDSAGSRAQLQRIVLSTAVASTSGTSIDFTSIPSWVKRITVMLANLSTTGTVPITFRLGTSGGIQATGYAGSQGYTGASTAFTNMSTGFEIYNDTVTITYSGSITFHLLDASTNLWVANGLFGTVNQAYARVIGGYVSLGGTLTQLRITTTTATPTFDLGTVNILYEG